MRRVTALLLAVVLLCGCAPGQSAQNAGTAEQGTQTADETGQDAQTTDETGQDEQTAGAADQNTQTSGASLQPAAAEQLPQEGTLPQVDFPDWIGYADDTLAMNSMYSFYGCHGQGALYVRVSEGVESFRMYVNGTPVATEQMAAGGSYKVDLSACALDGVNTLQVSNIEPSGLQKAISVCVPYPEVLEGTPEEAGISPQSLELISDLIESDIANGFTSAQLAVVRNGRLIYENAWGGPTPICRTAVPSRTALL